MRTKINIQVTKRKPGNPKGNPEALKPYQYKKGQSGNPSGRPKGSGSALISKAYAAALTQKVPDDVKEALGLEGKVTWADAIALQMVREAATSPNAPKVSMPAVQELREVTEGKVPDKIEATGKDGAPLPSAPPSFAVQFVSPPGGKKDEAKK